MTTTARGIALCLAVVLLPACTCESQPEGIVEGEEVSDSPFGAFGQLAEAGKRMEKMQAEMAEMEPVEPLHFSKLIERLPGPRPGWDAGEPRGSSKKIGEYAFTQVECVFTQGDKRMTVEIHDWAFNQALYATFYMTAAFSEESTEGYDKGLTIGEDSGRERYTHATKNGSFGVLVARRFWVSFEGRGIESPELRAWWDDFDADALRDEAE